MTEPTQPLTEGEPFEDGFMVSHQQALLDEIELDKIRRYFKEHVQPGGDLSDPDGTMPRVWMGRLLADAGLSRQMLSRLRAENTALRASLDQFNSFPDNPGPGNWSTSYHMGYADAGRDVRALARALGVGDSSDPSALDQSGEGQANV